MSVDKIADRYARKGQNGEPAKPNETNGKNGHKKKPPGPHQIFYDSPKRAFWAQNSRGIWTEYPTTHIRLILLKCGFSHLMKEGDNLSEFDEVLHSIRQESDVELAGPVAGYAPGLQDICGQRILVTSGPKLITPQKGKWENVKNLMGDLLGEQVEVLWGWLQAGLLSLRHGYPWRPGQALAIAGPAGCGKSLLQGLFTEIFGGRVAKPYRYLCGETPFNGELLGAEHLMIEDEAASTDLRTRRTFGSQLKGMMVNETVSFHQKGRQAMMLTPFWRVSITLNDEAENLMVLPPLDESLKDKISLLKAFHATMPYELNNLDQRRAYRAQLTAELPAFLYFLQSWKVPARLCDKRFGIKAFQNGELLGELESLQPEFRLLELIDTLQPWEPGESLWRGTAAELRRRLEDKDKRGEVGRLLSFNTACGAYLGRLVKHLPKRIQKKRNSENQTVWEVIRP